MYLNHLRQASSKLVANRKVSRIAGWIFGLALLTATKVWADDDTVPLDPQLTSILDFLRSLWHFLKDLFR